MRITTARILDKRRMLKKTGTYRLAIRVTCDRKPVPFPIDLDLSEGDFKKLSSPRIGKELSEIREKFIEEEDRAKEIIKKMGTFTFQAFRREFYKGKITTKKDQPLDLLVSDGGLTQSSLLPHASEGRNKKYGKRKYDRIRSNVNYEALGPLAVAFGEKIKLLELQERIGTSEGYFTTLQSLLRFRPGLRIEDVTEVFLYQFERWMLSKGNSYTTIGIYLRTLRAIINTPANKKLLSEEDYPFGKGKYQIPTGTNVKKSLDLLDIKKIYDFQGETDCPNELYSRDIWLFGYYANGINPKDIAHLKYGNIEDDEFFAIIREKTKFTTRTKAKQIIIPINDEMRLIMNRWGNSDKTPDNYIFPILTTGISAHRRYELVQGFTTMINKWMAKIANSVGIKKKVRTMEYRHSTAIILRDLGASTEFIKEALGHENISTTENYLNSFKNKIKKEYSNRLLEFKNIQTDML